MVSRQQFQNGIIGFIDKEIASKADGLNKFKVYFLMPIINKKVAQTIETYSKEEMTKDMFDENCNIDIESIYSMAKSAIQKTGNITIWGIIFSESDIDKLYLYTKGEVV